jgi:site-specific recombinase
LDQIQEQFMLSGDRAWYAPESRIEALEQAIADKLVPERDRLRQELADNYDEAFQEFQSRLKVYLKAIDMLESYQALENQFPSLPELIAKLGFEVTRWEAIESLQDLQAKAQEDPALAGRLGFLEKTWEDLEAKTSEIQDEMYEKVFLVVKDLGSGENVAPQVRRWIDGRLERLESLLGLWKSARREEHLLAEVLTDLRVAVATQKSADWLRQEWKGRSLSFDCERLREWMESSDA